MKLKKLIKLLSKNIKKYMYSSHKIHCDNINKKIYDKRIKRI